MYLRSRLELLIFIKCYTKYLLYLRLSNLKIIFEEMLEEYRQKYLTLVVLVR